jgi:hypothetical protein
MAIVFVGYLVAFVYWFSYVYSNLYPAICPDAWGNVRVQSRPSSGTRCTTFFTSSSGSTWPLTALTLLSTKVATKVVTSESMGTETKWDVCYEIAPLLCEPGHRRALSGNRCLTGGAGAAGGREDPRPCGAAVSCGSPGPQ